MPKPMADETEEKYISRCMGDENMMANYADNDERAAVCYRYWDKKDAPDDPKEYARRDFAYNEDQARDENGRWTSGGGSSDITGKDQAPNQDAGRGWKYDPPSRLAEGNLPDGTRTTQQREKVEKYPSPQARAAAADKIHERLTARGYKQIEEGASWMRAYVKSAGGDKMKYISVAKAGSSGLRITQNVKRGPFAKEQLDLPEQPPSKFTDDRESFARMDNVELFAAGTWNGLPFTESDLDGIVSSFDALNLSGRVPLKLGHDGPDVRRDPLTQLSMGWVQSVKRVGDKLLGTIEVPDKVRGLFKDGYLKFVSIELLKDVKASTRKIPWVLDAVALLGTDQPAVGILSDLQSFTMARRELEFESCVSFARADMRPFHSINGDNTDMSNDKTALQELSDRLLALSSQVNDLQGENRALKARDAEFAQTRARFERLQDDVKRKEIEAHRTKLTGRIEQAVKSEDITPAARERFNKVYRVDDDAAVVTISIDDVEEFVRENPNPHKKKPRTRNFTSLSSPDADIPMDVPVDVEASMRVEAFLRQSGVKAPTDRDIQAAAVAMFKSNPELGARYKAAADAQYGK